MEEGATIIRNVSGGHKTDYIGSKNFTIDRALLEHLLPRSDFDSFTQVSAVDAAISFNVMSE